jgi:spatacsin
LLHELEIRIWLLAVEAEVEAQAGRDQETILLGRSSPSGLFGTVGLRNGEPASANPVDSTASAVAGVDSHLKRSNTRSQSDISADDNGRGLARSRSIQIGEVSSSRSGSASRMKRRTKQLRRTQLDNTDDGSPSSPEDSRRNSLDRRDSLNRSTSGDDRESLNRHHSLSVVEGRTRDIQITEAHGDVRLVDDDFPAPDDETRGWEERVGEGEVERAVLALVEVGQVTAARQLQQKLAPLHVPLELLLVEAAQKIATLSMPTTKGAVVPAFLHPTVVECLRSTDLFESFASVTPMQVQRSSDI